MEDEARLHQRLLIIQGQSVKIQNALGIYRDPHADRRLTRLEAELVNMVRRPRLGIELELITQPRASATQHAKAQYTVDALFLKRLVDLSDSLLRYLDLRLGLFSRRSRSRGQLQEFRHGCLRSPGRARPSWSCSL